VFNYTTLHSHYRGRQHVSVFTCLLIFHNIDVITTLLQYSVCSISQNISYKDTFHTALNNTQLTHP